MSTTFNLSALRKDGAAALAKQLGLRRDWARVKLPEIVTMLRAFTPDQLIEAARSCPDWFDEEDIENLTSADYEAEAVGDDEDAEAAVEDAVIVGEAVAVSATPQAAAAVATQQSAAPAPKVDEVASLLARLLASGSTVNPEQVAAIVDAKVKPLERDLTAARVQMAEAISAAFKATQEEIAKALANVPAREIIVKQAGKQDVKIEGIQHREFETLLQACGARQPDGHRLNVWLYGPPGTGKTTAARNVAKALDLPFYCNGSLSTKYELTGFMDAHGKLVRTPFREAWENGGVYLYDEIDGSVPQAVVAFNAALANGVMAFPDGMIERHADCVIIAAANTNGQGGTAEFTGRMKLDAATLDRFLMLEWGIDEKLEEAMCARPEWLAIVRTMRKRFAEKGIKIAITPRATLYGASLLDQGMATSTVKTLVFRKGLSAEQWSSVSA